MLQLARLQATPGLPLRWLVKIPCAMHAVLGQDALHSLRTKQLEIVLHYTHLPP